MTGRLRELWDRLDVEGDERAVLSAVLERQRDDLVLRCASLLVGPPSIAATGWPGWRLAEDVEPPPSEAALQVPASFALDLGQAVVGRAVMSVEAARQWTEATLARGRCPAFDPLPGARAELAATRAPIRVCTQSETVAGDLATRIGRPINGYYFARADEPADIRVAGRWEVHGHTLYTPAVDLLGISWFDTKIGSPPSGLLIGRMERRAWLAGQQLLPDDDLYKVHLHLDPGRVELADLELEVEERVGDEIVIAERLRLEDVDNRKTEDQPRISVVLPTLGRKVKRSVRLHHRDGSLLDAWQPFNLFESVGLTFAVNGHEQRTRWIGDRRNAPEVVELLGAVERVTAQYAHMRRGGLVQRLFDKRKEARAALRRLLERSQGELMVLDPWLRDWDLLAGLPGPSPRILVGSGVLDPPPAFEGRVRRWRDGLNVPFHDRFFLWEGGGVSVGTSMDGRDGARLFRMVRIPAVEADELRTRFALWWADPRFEQIA